MRFTFRYKNNDLFKIKMQNAKYKLKMYKL